MGRPPTVAVPCKKQKIINKKAPDGAFLFPCNKNYGQTVVAPPFDAASCFDAPVLSTHQ